MCIDSLQTTSGMFIHRRRRLVALRIGFFENYFGATIATPSSERSGTRLILGAMISSNIMMQPGSITRDLIS